MRELNRLVLLLVLLGSGCSDNVHEKEQYRFIVGETSADLMVTSMHLNEVVLSKAIAGIATDRDQSRVSDSLAALQRHEERIDRMLKDMYDKPDLRTRDEAIKPLLREIIASTVALNQYMLSRDRIYRDTYFKHRDRLVEDLEKLKKEGVSNKPSELNATGINSEQTLTD